MSIMLVNAVLGRSHFEAFQLKKKMCSKVLIKINTYLFSWFAATVYYMLAF